MELILFFNLLASSAFAATNLKKNLWMDDDVVYDEGPHLVDRRMAYIGPKWPGGIVPYVVGSNLESIYEIIKEVAKEYAQKTCIRFVPKKPSDEHYVQFVRDDCECGLATVCKAGGVQYVWIGKDCLDYDTVVHELGHAICMSHEHQRPDRDEYLTLRCTQYPKRDDGYSTLGLMYDYMSVMHYQHCRGNCMEPKLAGVKQCGGLKLSVLDSEKINSLYNCGGCHGYRFRPGSWNGSNVFVAGVDIDGIELGVCRAYVAVGDIVPGKRRIWGGSSICHIPHGGTEHFVRTFEVLTKVNKKIFGWHSMRRGEAVPHHSIPGGRNKHGEPLYIGRCKARHAGHGTIVPGKIDNGRMYYTYGSQEHECEKFEVLRCLEKLSAVMHIPEF